MPNRQAIKGKNYERELVALFKKLGYDAERAWGSDGRALGEAKSVDLLLRVNGETYRIQAKRPARIAEYIKPPEGADIVVMREDHGSNLVVLPLDMFLELVDE